MESIRPIKIDCPEGKSVYFVSDLHLGAPDYKSSRDRERHFLRWLDAVEDTMGVLFIIGDLFDFWFEYKRVVPKGFVRLLGRLAQINDRGIPIHFFTGNHDFWIRDYLSFELGFILHTEHKEFIISNKRFVIGHGDGLGPNDYGYKRMKLVLTNHLFKWFYRQLHPDVGVFIGDYLSRKNKVISGSEDLKYRGPEGEWLIKYAERKLESSYYDYFIFGHRHLPIFYEFSSGAIYLNTGDWLSHFSFGLFDGKALSLCYFKE